MNIFNTSLLRRAVWLGIGLSGLFSQADAALFERSSADLQKEVRAAGHDGKQLAIFLTLADCPNCLEMERTVHTNGALEQAFSRQFRSVRLDISDASPLIAPSGKSSTAADFARSLHAVATPSFAFFDQDGQVLYHYTGTLDAAGLRSLGRYVAREVYEKRPFVPPRRAAPKPAPPMPASAIAHASHAGHIVQP